MTNLVTANSAIRRDEDETPNVGPAGGSYLRALFDLTEGDRPATTSRLARRLGVRPASVTAMLQKLAAAEPPLVAYHKSRGARLTGDGRRAALALVRCHRLLELFLHERLGYAWDEVHDEADRLEHVVGPALVERLAAALGHPTRDPHGHAIPAADLSLPAAADRPLGELPPGQPAVVAHVSDDDPALLRQMDALGLRPGAVVSMAGAAGAGASLVIIAGAAPLAVPAAVVARVFVAPAGQRPPGHGHRAPTQSHSTTENTPRS